MRTLITAATLALFALFAGCASTGTTDSSLDSLHQKVQANVDPVIFTECAPDVLGLQELILRITVRARAGGYCTGVLTPTPPGEILVEYARRGDLICAEVRKFDVCHVPPGIFDDDWSEKKQKARELL